MADELYGKKSKTDVKFPEMMKITHFLTCSQNLHLKKTTARKVLNQNLKATHV